jgi:transposase-like protein
VREVCREHQIGETLYYNWRDKLLEGGRAALAGKEEREVEREPRKQITRNGAESVDEDAGRQSSLASFHHSGFKRCSTSPVHVRRLSPGVHTAAGLAP